MKERKPEWTTRVGPYRLTRCYQRKSAQVDRELGRLYEAHHVDTSEPALVLIPDSCPVWEPEGDWDIRAVVYSAPTSMALQVRRAPAAGQLTELRDMLALFAATVGRVVNVDEARAHLTRPPLPFPLRLARSEYVRRIAQEVTVFLGVLFVGGLLWYVSDEDRGEPQVTAGTVVAAVARPEADATFLLDMRNAGSVPIAYPLPSEPFRNQAKAPCRPELDEVEINGGCWVALDRRPPCREMTAEYRGKCYLPSAKDRGQEPNVIRR